MAENGIQLPGKIEAIYVISRESDTDRLEKVKEQLDSLGLPFIHVVAVEPDFEQEFFEQLRRKMHWNRNSRAYQKGALGCLLSHVSVCAQALQLGQKRIMVLEDDALISQNLVAEINRAIEFLDSLSSASDDRSSSASASAAASTGWDLFYLETTFPDAESKKGHVVVHRTADGRPLVMKTHGNYCTAGMILQESAMIAISTQALSAGKEIDRFLAQNFAPFRNCYMNSYPLGVIQGPNKSTITGANRGARHPAIKPLYNPAEVRNQPMYPTVRGRAAVFKSSGARSFTRLPNFNVPFS
jgi:GR25 family glycosyltransferase involved in LPS biosynthesis